MLWTKGSACASPQAPKPSFLVCTVAGLDPCHEGGDGDSEDKACLGEDGIGCQAVVPPHEVLCKGVGLPAHVLKVYHVPVAALGRLWHRMLSPTLLSKKKSTLV